MLRARVSARLALLRGLLRLQRVAVVRVQQPRLLSAVPPRGTLTWLPMATAAARWVAVTATPTVSVQVQGSSLATAVLAWGRGLLARVAVAGAAAVDGSARLRVSRRRA